MQRGFDLLIRRLHSGAHEPVSYEPLPIDIPMPKDADVTKVVNLLNNAKKPLVLVGSQATCLGKSDMSIR